MQSTGQASTHAVSFVPMQGSATIYAIVPSQRLPTSSYSTPAESSASLRAASKRRPDMRARSEERRLLGMDELSRQVLKLFIAMAAESLDLHTLFEAGGNEPASRQRVFDVVTRLADTGYLESRGSDFTCSLIRVEGPLGEAWDTQTDSARGLRRSGVSGTRISTRSRCAEADIPRSSSPRATGLDQIRMAADRRRPHGQVLLAHNCGPSATRKGVGELESTFGSDQPGRPGGMI